MKNEILKPLPGIAWQTFGDGAVVLQAKEGLVHELNDVGASIWLALSNGEDSDQIAAALSQEYEVSLEEARCDVAEFFASLRGMKLVE